MPLDSRLAFGKFGTRLDSEFGIEGIGVWVLFLAACKREPTQGTFTFSSEDEAWSKIGSRPPVHTFQTYLTFFGRMKQTRSTRSGRTTYVEIRGWDEWNTPKTRGQNPRSEPQITNGLSQSVGEMSPDVAPELELEVEVEGDSEGSAVREARGEETTARPIAIAVERSLRAAS